MQFWVSRQNRRAALELSRRILEVLITVSSTWTDWDVRLGVRISTALDRNVVRLGEDLGP